LIKGDSMLQQIFRGLGVIPFEFRVHL